MTSTNACLAEAMLGKAVIMNIELIIKNKNVPKQTISPGWYSVDTDNKLN